MKIIYESLFVGKRKESIKGRFHGSGACDCRIRNPTERSLPKTVECGFLPPRRLISVKFIPVDSHHEFDFWIHVSL